jgi:hypothetical protein
VTDYKLYRLATHCVRIHCIVRSSQGTVVAVVVVVLVEIVTVAMENADAVSGMPVL